MARFCCILAPLVVRPRPDVEADGQPGPFSGRAMGASIGRSVLKTGRQRKASYAPLRTFLGAQTSTLAPVQSFGPAVLQLSTYSMKGALTEAAKGFSAKRSR